MSTTTGTAAALEAARMLVTSNFRHTFAGLEPMRLGLVQAFTTRQMTSSAVNETVEPLARRLLADGLLLGTGFVASREALTDKTWYLAWWQGQRQQLLGEAGSVTGLPLDYTKREWFRRPSVTGERHVAGPYVDYVCSDEFVVTATQPVVVDGRMVGVVGSDILAETLEHLLLDAITAADAILVNDHGRAVISADHRIGAGDMVDLAAYSHALPCGDFPLRLVAH